MPRIELGDWEAMRHWAEPFRFAVFVEEQKVPAEMELDSLRPAFVHAVAFDADGGGNRDRAFAARWSHRAHGCCEAGAR